MDKKRILVFSTGIVTTNAFFLESKVFESLTDDFDIYICAYGGLKGSDPALFEGRGFKKIYSYSSSDKRMKVAVLELSVNTLGGRKYSPSCEIMYNMSKESYGGKLKRMVHRALGSTELTASWTQRLLETYVGFDAKLQAIMDEVMPDAIVTFLGGGSVMEIESLKIAKRNGIPSIGIQYGWDNISTNGLMPFTPDFVGVWGYQSRMFAEKIHKVPADRIFHVGAPFADLFRNPNNVPAAEVRQRLRLPADKKVILFAGNIWSFNEVRNLKRLEDAIENKELPSCCILYRPHPFQHYEPHDLDYFAQNFKHIYIDPMVEEQYRSARERKQNVSMKNTKVLVDFEHFKQIFSIVEGTITPLSTFMIQGAVCGVPCVGVAYMDDVNKRFRPRFNFAHFNLTKSMPGVQMALQSRDLLPMCKKMLEFSADPRNRILLKQYASLAVQDDILDVSGRLQNAIEAIVTPQSGSLFSYLSQANRRIKLDTADEVIIDEIVAG